MALRIRCHIQLLTFSLLFSYTFIVFKAYKEKKLRDYMNGVKRKTNKEQMNEKINTAKKKKQKKVG